MTSSAVVDRRMMPVSCHKCGHNMWGESTTEGDDRVFVMECINPECDNPPYVEVLHRESVNVGCLCGPGGRVSGVIGHVWAVRKVSKGEDVYERGRANA